jgi:hypothetical protein
MIPTRADFTDQEWKVIRKHRTPAEVQKFLSEIPYNMEIGKESCSSFRGVLIQNRAHCLEGALVAATILEQYGYPPMVVSIESEDRLDHVVFLFKADGRYGAIARSRVTGLHGRKPVFRTARDLVMSYFDPFIDKTGRVTGYATASLYELGNYDWRFSTQNVWRVERFLQEIPHKEIRSSEARFETMRRRYLEFHKQYPDRWPEYYSNRHLWMP